MTVKYENLFWEELPNPKRWKGTITIASITVLVLIISFGIASAKYGVDNVSYVLTHGRLQPNESNNTSVTLIDTTSRENNKDITVSGSALSDNSSDSGANADREFSGGSSSRSDYGLSNNITSLNDKKAGISFVIPPELESTGAIAICNDYTYSHEQHNSSTCSTHQGVMYWLDGTDSNTTQRKKVCVENTSMKQLYEQQYQNQVNSIKQQETYELGQARVDMANRGIDSALGSYLATIQSIEDKYDLQLSNLKIEYDQKIKELDPICHYE